MKKNFPQKNWVGTYKGQSEHIRDNWYFSKKLSVSYTFEGL